MAANRTGNRRARQTDDDHTGIPRDADGVPVFLILPPAIRASYESKMARCERGWRATRDPAFIAEAKTWSHFHRQPDPLWLSEAVIELCAKRRTKGYKTRVHNAAIRQMRFEAVRDAVRDGMLWKAAYAEAVEELANTRAAGKWPTMKKAYDNVMRDRKNGRGDRYLAPLVPLVPHRKLGDGLKRKPSPR